MGGRLGAPCSARAHLGDRVGEYVDRALPVAELLVCDRHVTMCPSCAAAAAQEQQMLLEMRRTDVPGLNQRLHLALLQMAVTTPSGQVAAAWPAPDRAQLPIVRRGAPSMHRSARRAVVVATVVAGACAAAACSIVAVAPSGQPASTTGPMSARALASSSSIGVAAPAAFVASRLRVPIWKASPAESRP